MTKQELANRIINAIDENEWAVLKASAADLHVNDHNKNVLLGIKENASTYSGEVEDKDVDLLETEVYAFLKKVWSDQPQAHKYIVNACLALTFLLEEPMHPQTSVNFKIVEKDGKKEYYCPAKQDSIICNFCVSKAL